MFIQLASDRFNERKKGQSHRNQSGRKCHANSKKFIPWVGKSEKEVEGGGFPCYHCQKAATVEKAGKSLCAVCKGLYKGVEFPLQPMMNSRERALDYRLKMSFAYGAQGQEYDPKTGEVT